MSDDQLVAVLAKRVMRWTVGPDRFGMGDRRWQPRWRFQPTERVADAFRLLEKAAPQEYAMGAAEHGHFRATVRIAALSGKLWNLRRPER